MRNVLIKLSFFCALCALFSCAKSTDEPNVSGDYYEAGDAVPGGESVGGDTGSGNGQAGMVTAGEWRDLDNWAFWSKLMTVSQPDQTGESFSTYSDYWHLYTNNRVAVRVTNDINVPQRDVVVQLTAGNNIIYEGRTDNRGEVNLFFGLTQKTVTIDTASLALVVDGTKLLQTVQVTGWNDDVKWNECNASVSATQDIDIAFIVDATGSMGDEINFLKEDVTDILKKIAAQYTAASIRTAALFYRDHDGDEYVTRVNDFTADVSATQAFINKQSADGGGDYPEAVHTALEEGLQKLSWRESNCIRLCFMLLDAPPHHENEVISSLQHSVPMYAKRGIRIIPVAASGVDKPTEFFLRFTAISTDATYVFITNDSGVGGEHIEATVGQYEVELLNALIVRLISHYME